MNNSKEYLKSNNIVPFISFKEKPHTVTLIKDEISHITDETGKEIQGVKYLVLENDVQKSFFTSSIGLIQKLSEYNENDVVTIEMKSKKGEKGWVSYYEVTPVTSKLEE